MKNYKFFTIAVLFMMLLTACAEAQTKKKQSNANKTKNKATKPVAEKPAPPVAEDFKIIAEGAQSNVEEPFIFVARDAQTYALLKNLVKDLPDASTIDFTKQAVVAAFAGTKPTAGYSVAIRKAGEKIVADILEPGKDMMVAQVLTAPYKIVVVPVAEENALPLEAAAAWTNKMAIYRLARGSNFSYSGGFAYRERKFDAEGEIGVLTFGELATVSFNLTAKGDKNLMLSETASGTIKDGKFNLSRLDAGTFSEMPRPSLNVSGTIAEKKISLKFEPNPTQVADGFAARGSVEATKAN
jgi:hypothetical protein